MRRARVLPRPASMPPLARPTCSDAGLDARAIRGRSGLATMGGEFKESVVPTTQFIASHFVSNTHCARQLLLASHDVAVSNPIGGRSTAPPREQRSAFALALRSASQPSESPQAVTTRTASVDATPKNCSPSSPRQIRRAAHATRAQRTAECTSAVRCSDILASSELQCVRGEAAPRRLSTVVEDRSTSERDPSPHEHLAKPGARCVRKCKDARAPCSAQRKQNPTNASIRRAAPGIWSARISLSWLDR